MARLKKGILLEKFAYAALEQIIDPGLWGDPGLSLYIDLTGPFGMDNGGLLYWQGGGFRYDVKKGLCQGKRYWV
jgi:hypothetical protein